MGTQAPKSTFYPTVKESCDGVAAGVALALAEAGVKTAVAGLANAREVREAAVVAPGSRASPTEQSLARAVAVQALARLAPARSEAPRRVRRAATP